MQTTYDVKKKENGVYAFILKGDFTINGQELNERDGMGVWDVQQLDITANSEDASILLMEVPMTLTQA
ncbi:Quercetin 2,3-dioxygenase [compost metagenome]